MSALRRFGQLRIVEVSGGRELERARVSSQPVSELAPQVANPSTRFLVSAGHADQRGPVAQMSLDLADDVRGRERRKADTALRVEAIDRLDQADRPDLNEVFETFAAMREALRECAN